MRIEKLFLAGMLILGSPVFADGGEPLANWPSPPYWAPSAAVPEARGPAPAAGRTPEAGRQPLAVGPTALPFTALTPCRIVDTRGNAPLTGGFLPPATVRSYTVTGVCGIPANAQALSLNATVVHPTGPGFLTLYPQGGAFPPVSTLNYLGSDVIVNAAVVPLSVSGGISMALGVSGGDVILDTNGYYAPQTVVTTLNGASGDVTLAAGANVTLTPSGSTLTIASTGGVALAGSGSASTASHSDHDHFGASWTAFGSPLTINQSNPSNPAIHGIANQWGVHGTSSSSNPLSGGVFGETNNAGGNGVIGAGGPGTGVKGTSTGNNGVYGTSSSSAASGVYAENTSGGYGVAARVSGTGGVSYAVYGELLTPSGSAIFGRASGAGVAITGWNPANTAGSFVGNVNVSGSLSKGGGSFKIDHPLDPENKYLYHSFVESPDMMNIYSGVAVFDAAGEARVALPAWFDSLNRDFRYQLTSIGAPQPDLHVKDEIAGNAFRIGGGRPGMRVSWQVTGIRRDAWAESHRIPVEEVKPEGERGRFLHPKEHGRRAEDGIGWGAGDRSRAPID